MKELKIFIIDVLIASAIMTVAVIMSKVMSGDLSRFDALVALILFFLVQRRDVFK